MEASFDIAVVGGPKDLPGLGEAGDGEGEEDLPRPAGKVGNDLAFGLLQKSFLEISPCP